MTLFCTSQTESPRSCATRERVGWRRRGGRVVVGRGAAGEPEPHQSARLYFHEFFGFIFFGRRVHPPCRTRGLFVFAASRCADPKYTSPVTSSQKNTRTHTYTHARWDIHCLSRHVSLPTPPAQRPLPAARTHILSHRPPCAPTPIPSHLPP